MRSGGAALNTHDRAYAYLGIIAPNLPLEEITAGIGIIPTKAWRQGDPGKYTKSSPHSGWCLYSPLQRTELRLDTHVEALLNMLDGKQEVLRKLSESYDIYIVGVAHYSPDRICGMYLSKNVLRMIVAMGASIDFDLYDAASADQDI